MNLGNYSECSSEEEDVPIQSYCHMIENLPLRINCDKYEDDDEVALKPKMATLDPPQIPNHSMKFMSNDSKVSLASKKNLANAYTFKLGTPQRKRKHDPVSLYQKTSQSWKNSKFLKSRGDNKEGRKLELAKRNLQDKIL